MALTLTTEGMTAPDITPQAPPELAIDPNDVFGMEPPDWRDDHEKEMDMWREESAVALDAAVLDPKSYGDERVPHGFTADEWRKTRVVDDWMRLHSDGQDPPMGPLREFERGRLAQQAFGGAGADSDDALFTEITGKAQGRKDARDRMTEVRQRAIVDVFTSEDEMTEGKLTRGNLDWPQLKAELESKPGYDSAREPEMMAAFYDTRAEAKEKLNAYKAPLDMLWGAMRAGKSPDEFGRVAYDTASSIPKDKQSEFLEAVALRAQTLPKEEQASFWANFSKATSRGISSFRQGAVEEITRFALNAQLPDATYGDKWETRQPADQEFLAARAGKAADFRLDREFVRQVQDINNGEYDPIQYLSEKDSGKRIMEEIAYQVVPVTVNSLTMAVPYAGLTAMFAGMKGGAHNTLMNRFTAAGMETDAALDAAEKWSVPMALVETALEKAQYGIWARSMPGFTKALDGIGDQIANRALRMGAKTLAIGVAETAVEVAQDTSGWMIQDVAAGLDEDLPDVQWTGEGGAFDGFWANSAVIFGTMLPLSILGAAGGLSAESRNAAFRRADPLERLALGMTPEASAAIDDAAGPSSLARAIDQAWNGRDPNSPEAQAAVEKLKHRVEQTRRASTLLEDIGYSMPAITAMPDGSFVVRDNLTGEEVGRATNTTELDAVVRGHTVAMESMQEDEMRQLATWLGAAKVAAKESGIEQELSLSRRFGMQDVEAMGPAAVERFMAEVALQEQAEGGDGSATRAVFGMNLTETRDGVKHMTNRIFQGANLGTMFHENWHAARTKAKAAGNLTREDDIRFLRAFDAALKGRQTREVKAEDGSTLAPATRESFLPDGMADEEISETMLDESIAEVAEVLTFLFPRNHKTNKHGLTRKLVSTYLGTVGRLAPEATRKFSGYIRAIRAKMGLAMSRAYHVKKAITKGELDPAEIDSYMGKLFGTDEQAEHDDGVQVELTRILNQEEVEDDNIPFSVGRYQQFRFREDAPTRYVNSNTGVLFPTGHEIQTDTAEPDSLPETDRETWDRIRQGNRRDALQSFRETSADGVAADDWLWNKLDRAKGIEDTVGSGREFWTWLKDTVNGPDFEGVDPADTLDALAGMLGLGAPVMERGAANEQLYYAAITEEGQVLVADNASGKFSFGTLPSGEQVAESQDFHEANPEDYPVFAIGRVEERPFYSTANVKDLRHDKTAWLKDDNARGKGNRDEADEIISKYYKTAAYAGIPKDAILVPVPSTSGHNILPAALAVRISKDFGQEYEKRRVGSPTAKSEAKNKRSFFDKESDPVGFVPNESVIADLKGKRVFITEDVHNTGESWIAFARMLQDHGVEVVGVATLTSTEQRETSPRDMERMSEKMAELLGMPLDEVLPAVHSLFYGTFKQLFNKAEAEISRANTRSNASNARKVFDIASSGRRAGAYSNPLRDSGQGAGSVSRAAIDQDTFQFSIGRAEVASRMQGGALSLVRDPIRRVQAMSRVARDFGDLSLAFQRIEALAGRRMSKGQLRQEANAREDMAADEKTGAVWARYGSLLADDDLTRVKSQPVHAYLSVKRADGKLDPLHGRLMSKAQAIKRYPESYALHRGGDYDGADNISRSIYGGQLMPDQAAQELFDAGLISEPYTDAMWEALEREQNSVIKNKEFLAKALEEIREAKREAKREASEWLATQGKEQETNYNPKQEILASLRMLDAILLALPPEIRGKIGGYTQMAMIATDEARLSFLKDKLKKADKELETFLRESFNTEWLDLLKRAKPDKDNPGQRPIGQIDADALDILRAAEAAMWLDFSKGEAEADRLDALAEHEDTPAEDADKLRVTAQMVRLTTNWSSGDAARREQAVIEGTRIYYGGLMALRVKNSARAERLRGLQTSAKQGTGQAGDRMDRKKMQRKEKAGRTGQAGRLVWEFLSFGQLTNVLFGESSAAAKWFNAKEIAASNAYEDGVQAKADAIESMFESLSGSRFSGEKLRHRMQTKEAIQTTDAHGTQHTFTEAEGISFLLMWRQEDGRRHMEGQIDDEGNLTSEWGWTEQAATDIANQLTPEAKAMMAFLGTSYGEEYGRINDVFRRIWNVSMPRHKFYAPLTVKPSMGKQDAIVDPVSGDNMGVGMTPGSLKNRSQTAVTEPDFRDAFQVFLTHARQMEHFISYAEFARDAMAVVNRREIRNSIEAVSPTAATALGKWVDYFALGGLREAAAGGAWQQFFSGALSRLSSAALVGRVSVLGMQTLQLGAAAYKMPLGAYLSRFSRLMMGRLSWGEALQSPYIQRRMKEMPPVVRDAVMGLSSGSPNRAKYLATKAARSIAGADGLFTAGTYAILFDYHLTHARKAGIPNPETHAHAEAERLTDQVAQPMRTGARSWLEISMQNQPAFRALWNFSTDPRQKLALIAYEALRHDVSGKDKAAAVAKAAAVSWAVSGILQAVLRSVFRDLRNDDDDELFDERHWDLKRLGLMAAVGPIGGIPYIGGMIEDSIYNAAGEWKPVSNLIDAVSASVPAAGRLVMLDSDDVLKDIEKVLNGAAFFSGTSAAGTSAMHAVRDAVNIYENFDDED